MTLRPAPLILGSSSVYRKMMLERLGLPFECARPDVDETPHEGEGPVELSLRLAKEKAQDVASVHPEKIVIGADQVATLGSDVIGKAHTHEKAVAQLQKLSGKTVCFHSALAVVKGDKVLTKDVVTECRFRKLDNAEIEHYLQYERPYDTAGSAKAESLGISLMESMKSDDPTAIIGLPLIELSRMLREFGVNPTLLAAKD